MSPLPPHPHRNVVAKKRLISTHGGQNSTLFRVEGEGLLVLLILLERSQHFWPPIVWKPLRADNYMLPYELLQNDDFNAGIELSTTV